MQQKELRVLILEDDLLSVEVMVAKLRAEKIPFTFKHVMVRKDFLAALKDFKPDLILADYKLPDFDGMEAIRLVKEKAPDVSVIIVTGIMDEAEVAVECLKEGAVDYILKDRLNRLIPAVKNVLVKKEVEREKEKAYDELRRSRAQYQQMVDNVPGMVCRFFMRPDGFMLFSFVSERSREIFGLSPEEIQKDANAFLGKIHFEDRESFYHCINESAKTLSPCVWEARILVGEATKWIRGIFRPEREENGDVLWDGLIMDITERKKVEESSRLAQLGELAAGIAHEVSDPIQIIFARAQLASMPEVTHEERNKNLEIIKGECNRAADIIQRLLVFAKPGKGALKKTDINNILDFIANILEPHFIHNNIKIIRAFSTAPLYVKIDEKQMQEVFMNLLRNASDAMPDGGTITIKTSRAAKKARIDVIDTGVGIPEKNIGRIFDPFFTTKEKGTGLGLSVCFGVIKAHDGELKYTSRVGHGTTASVFLPTI